MLPLRSTGISWASTSEERSARLGQAAVTSAGVATGEATLNRLSDALFVMARYENLKRDVD